MNIPVHGSFNAGMPQKFLKCLGRHPAFDGAGGIGVPQGVHTEPQGGCSLYRSSKTHQEQLLTKKARQKASQAVRERKRKLPQTLDRELAATLYDKGANDLQIGLACNVCKKTVANWRKATGRPSHQPRGKNYTEKEKTL